MPRRSLAVPAVLIVLGSLAWDILAWPSLDRFVNAFDAQPLLFRDFRVVYYPAAQAFFETKEPTPLYFYPPFFAFLISPLGSLPFDAALDVWLVVQILAVGCLILAPAKMLLAHGRRAWFAYVALVCFSHPVLHNFRWGQISTIVTALVLASAVRDDGSRRLGSASLLSLAISLKIYPAIFALRQLLRRDMRYLVTIGAIAGLLLGVIPAMALGPTAAWHYYDIVSEQTAGAVHVMRSSLNSENLTNVLMRLSTFWAPPNMELRPIFGLVPLSMLGAGLWLLYRTRDASSSDFPMKRVAFLFLLLPLAVETCWPHYFGYLPFCQMMVWLGASGDRRSRFLQRSLAVFSVILGSTVLYRAVDNWAVYCGLGFLTFSDLLLLIALAWQMLQTSAATPQEG